MPELDLIGNEECNCGLGKDFVGLSRCLGELSVPSLAEVCVS